MTQNASSPQGDRYRKVKQVLIAVLLANLAVTFIKIITGMVTGALAVVADGFHSLVDSSSNLIGLAAINLARRPADQRHPYGYRRYETLGALAIGGMLLLAAFEIAKAILERILHATTPDISPLLFWLVMLTFPVNLVVVILEKRAGNQLGSEILLADARHTQADLYVTASVLLSLIGVRLGWLWLDILVAAIVVIMILRASFAILRDTSRWLTDSIVIDADLVEEIAYRTPGVRYVHHIRSRGTPDSAFVDLHVKVDPGMSTSQAHAIANEIERRLVEQIEGVTDALVHIEPATNYRPTPWERLNIDLRSIADGLALGLHDLHIHSNHDGDLTIELHLEMNEHLSLLDAHQIADEFEAQVQKRWPQVGQILTHLEPVPKQVLLPGDQPDPKYEKQIRQILASHIPDAQIKQLDLLHSSSRTNAAIIITMPHNTSLAEAHTISEKIETDLLKQITGLDRVTVHVEPGLE